MGTENQNDEFEMTTDEEADLSEFGPETEEDFTGDEDEESFEDFLNDVEQEGDEDTTPKDGLTAEQTPAKEEPQKPDNWDKERQRADQAEANYRKAIQAQKTAEQKAETSNKRLDELEKELEKLTKVEEVNLDDIDEDVTDPKIVKAIKSLQQLIEKQKTETEKLKQAKEEIESEVVSNKKEAAREKSRQNIIASIESKLSKRMKVENPARFRNAAIKMADDICVQRRYSPEDRHEAATMLEDCYYELVEKANKEAATNKNKGKSSVPTDTGKGTGNQPVVKSETPQPCSHKQAVQDLRKKLKIG